MVRFKQYINEALQAHDVFRNYAGRATIFFRVRTASSLKQVLHRYGGSLRAVLDDSYIDCWDSEGGLHDDYMTHTGSSGIPLYIIDDGSGLIEFACVVDSDASDVRNSPLIRRIAPQCKITKI